MAEPNPENLYNNETPSKQENQQENQPDMGKIEKAAKKAKFEETKNPEKIDALKKEIDEGYLKKSGKIFLKGLKGTANYGVVKPLEYGVARPLAGAASGFLSGIPGVIKNLWRFTKLESKIIYKGLKSMVTKAGNEEMPSIEEIWGKTKEMWKTYFPDGFKNEILDKKKEKEKK